MNYRGGSEKSVGAAPGPGVGGGGGGVGRLSARRLFFVFWEVDSTARFFPAPKRAVLSTSQKTNDAHSAARSRSSTYTFWRPHL